MADGGLVEFNNNIHTVQDSIRRSQLLLQLPDDLSGVTKHHEDFVIVPGQKLKVKLRNEICPVIVEEARQGCNLTVSTTMRNS